nr:spermidine/putrescine ABC transporter substrate-binding protein [Lachnospiraceae bacterium]
MEVDSAKADIVAGKVVAGMQWSGDAVFSMDEAEKDEVYLNYACPEEATNLWFDGWVMMADAVSEDSRTQQAAEAFLNFISRPDNVVRNMYYIGYTSAISGGESDLIYQYLEYTYGAEEGEDDTVLYPLGYFFAGRDQADAAEYQLLTYEEQLDRQLFAQYPSVSVIDHCAVMRYFDTEANQRISQMWTNVRCFTTKDLFYE